jgi:hypothetical protein
MGTARYYLKAQFPENITEEKFQTLKDFFLEGSKAEEFWQDNRHKKSFDFWPDFEEQFPTVSLYLKDLNKFGKDCNNNLAGCLDFGFSDDIEANFTYSENLLTYNAEVWHFADWELLTDFLKGHFGARKTGWISDGYADIADLIHLK